MSSIQNAIYRLTHTVLTLADIALKSLSIIEVSISPLSTTLTSFEKT